mgnify:CR=1 FL=1
MKHIIKLGATVDDLTGDYLRIGGEKINQNFTNIFEDLGDGEILFPAGAWKTHRTVDGATLNIEFGEAYIVDTAGGNVTVILPANPTPSDYGKVIKLRDVRGQWSNNPITIQSGSGDYIGGRSVDEVINIAYSDVTLTLADNPAVSYDYKYIKGVTIDNVPQASTGDTILKKSILISSAQQDFLDIFSGIAYNIENLEVFKNGNEIYYGEADTLPPTADSDYGSIGGGSSLIPLNGTDVRLRIPAKIGDVITFKTYLASVGASKTTYQTYGVVLSDSAGASTNGEIITNLGVNPVITMAQLGAGGLEYNAGSLEVFIAGVKVPPFDSNGSANNITPFTYQTSSPGGVFSQIELFGSVSGDIVMEVRWLNGNIGSTLTIGEIEVLTDARYTRSDLTIVNRTNKITYPNAGINDYQTIAPAPNETAIRFTSVDILFDSIYPIGTIYKNAHNPANPFDYMGLGQWIPHQTSKTEIGFETGDPTFGIGAATGGSFDKTLTSDNIPTTDSGSDQYIGVDSTGNIELTGCNTDPNSVPIIVKAKIVEIGQSTPTAIDNTPSFVVVYSWRRIA